MSKHCERLILAAGVVLAAALPVGLIQAQKAAVTVVSPDGKLIATAKDNAITVSDVATQKEVLQFQGHTAAVNALAFSADGKLLASASQDKTVRVWELATGKLRFKFLGPAEFVAVAFSADGKTMTAEDSAKTRRVHDAATGKVVSQGQ